MSIDEEQVVAYALVNPKYALSRVDVEWLEDSKNRMIIGAAKRLQGASHPVTESSIFRHLYNAGEIDIAPYLGHLIAQASCQSAFDYHLSLLKAEATERIYAQIGEELKAHPEKAGETLANISDRIPKLDSENENVGEALDQIMNKLDAITSRSDVMLGTTTSYGRLNKLTNGFQPGQLWIVAARPSVGKTTLALNMMLRLDNPTALISLEMTQEECLYKLMFAQARVQFPEPGIPLDQNDQNRLGKARIAIQARNLLISCCRSVLFSNIAIEATALHRKGARVIFVDYLQLIHADNLKKNETRATEIAYVSGGLKRIARELQIPIVAACQLNREAAKEGVMPDLNHLRDSGSIEQDADVVLMLHQDPEVTTKLHVLIRKNRSGPIGKFELTFDKTQGRITEEHNMPAEITKPKHPPKQPHND